MYGFLDDSRIHPNPAKALEGSSVNLTCDSSGPVSWYYWEDYQIHLLPANAKVWGSKLFIMNVTKNNEGVFECQGTTSESYRWSFEEVKFAAQSSLFISKPSGNALSLSVK